MAAQGMQLDASFTRVRPSPVPAAANNLFTFLAQRFVFTYEANGLNCTKLLGQPDPIKVKTDGKGVAGYANIKGTKVSTPGCFSGNVIGLMGYTRTAPRNCHKRSLFFFCDVNPVNI